MPVAVSIPDLGDGVADATVSRWLKFPGDVVDEGEPLVEVSTDKVDTEISAPASGRLSEITAQEGTVLPIGAEIAVILEHDATSGEVGSELKPAAAAPVAPAPTEHASDSDTVAPGVAESATAISARPYVTPLVRRLAADLGIDLAELKGSGIGNRIRKSDVLAAATVADAATPGDIQAPKMVSPNPYLSPLVNLKVVQRNLDVSTLTGSGHNQRIRLSDLSEGRDQPGRNTRRSDRTEKLTRLRKTIAARMVESLQTSAQLTTVVEVDVTEVNHLRQQYGPAFAAEHGVKLTFTSFFLKAVIDILPQFPALNASIDTSEGTVTYYGGIHLNLAVDTERGLYAPVIRNADSADITRLAVATAELAKRARANSLTNDDLTGGTFTVTNTGSRGALFDTPIINQPQVAILGTGTVGARATVVRDVTGTETVDVRSMAYFSLTYDHRLIDGAEAARFLTAVKARIEGADFASELRQATGPTD